MDEEELFQTRLKTAKDYYHDAPESVWENPIVIRSIRRDKWGSCGVTIGDDGQPVQGLLEWTLNGYYFKYRGMPCYIQ